MGVFIVVEDVIISLGERTAAKGGNRMGWNWALQVLGPAGGSGTFFCAEGLEVNCRG